MRKAIALSALLLALPSARAAAMTCISRAQVAAQPATMILEGTVAAVHGGDRGSVAGFVDVRFLKGSAPEPVNVWYPNGSLGPGSFIAGSEVIPPQPGERWRISFYRGGRGYMTSACDEHTLLAAKGDHRLVADRDAWPWPLWVFGSAVAVAVGAFAASRRRPRRLPG